MADGLLGPLRLGDVGAKSALNIRLSEKPACVYSIDPLQVDCPHASLLNK